MTIFSSVKADDNVFLIDSVLVDISSDSASKARDQAIATAHRQAWICLVNRMVPLKYHSQAKSISDAELMYFVESFSLNSERHSAVRYIGDFKVGFQGQRVQQFFHHNHIPYLKTKGPRILILPLLKKGKNFLLWEEGNPWLQAWKNLKRPNSLITTVVPLGDLEDETLIDAHKILKNDRKFLLDLARHYQVEDVIIAIANLEESPASLKITASVSFLCQSLEKITLTAQESASVDLWHQGVEKFLTEIEEKWRAKALNTLQDPQTTLVSVKVTSAKQLQDVLQDLLRFSGIQKVSIKSLTCQKVRLAIKHSLPKDILYVLLQESLGFKILEIS